MRGESTRKYAVQHERDQRPARTPAAGRGRWTEDSQSHLQGSPQTRSVVGTAGDASPEPRLDRRLSERTSDEWSASPHLEMGTKALPIAQAVGVPALPRRRIARLQHTSHLAHVVDLSWCWHQGLRNWRRTARALGVVARRGLCGRCGRRSRIVSRRRRCCILPGHLGHPRLPAWAPFLHRLLHRWVVDGHLPLPPIHEPL